MIGKWMAASMFRRTWRPNLNASLTINTDFAETEVDARQVNLTRFDLFYPEKRAFFLEGAGVFDVATGNPMMPDLIPFFSRRIGLMEQDGIPTEVPITRRRKDHRQAIPI